MFLFVAVCTCCANAAAVSFLPVFSANRAGAVAYDLGYLQSRFLLTRSGTAYLLSVCGGTRERGEEREIVCVCAVREPRQVGTQALKPDPSNNPNPAKALVEQLLERSGVTHETTASATGSATAGGEQTRSLCAVSLRPSAIRGLLLS